MSGRGRREQSDERRNESVPKAVASGMLFGRYECHVLEDGERLMTQRGMLRAIRNDSADLTRGPEKGDLGRFLARLPKRFEHLTRGPEIEFEIPQEQGGFVRAIGRPASFFIALLKAYAEGYAAGELHHTQAPMAKRAIELLCMLADKALSDLIDDACGITPRSAAVLLELNAAKAECGKLKRELELYSPLGGLIGKERAAEKILGPIRVAAYCLCDAEEDFAHKHFNAHRRRIENQVRLHVRFPASKGQDWSVLGIDDLIAATQKALELLANAREQKMRTAATLRERARQVEMFREPDLSPPPRRPGLVRLPMPPGADAAKAIAAPKKTTPLRQRKKERA